MKVLIGCEYSGLVRQAFEKRGHFSVSCDFQDTEIPGCHYKGNVLDIINMGWDLGIFFPSCTYLCVSGAKWFKDRKQQQEEAIYFVKQLLLWSKIPKICVENPIGVLSTRIRKPNQIIQPWQFGHGETKATCLWTEGLPNLIPTNIVSGREARIHKMPPSPNRGKERSRTYQGIANAMAEQWG